MRLFAALTFFSLVSKAKGGSIGFGGFNFPSFPAYPIFPSPPPPPPTSPPTSGPTGAPTPPASLVPSTVPRSSGLETCCDEDTSDCRACEWHESRSCQQLLDEDAICGGDCCAFEDAPDGGCKWSTGGRGSCCVTTEGGSLWTLTHYGDKACPVSQYMIP